MTYFVIRRVLADSGYELEIDNYFDSLQEAEAYIRQGGGWIVEAIDVVAPPKPSKAKKEAK